ncbi:MAG: class I SAM-dependent DNA methyltransferase [Janthinobacterium lividum]
MSDRSWSGDVFDRLYADNPDPWDFETSEYERAKYAETLAALDGRRFGLVLELGCSIGIMTAALATRSERVVGVDIADAALERARIRCAEFGHVSFQRRTLPSEHPEIDAQSCDVVLVSELLYFLSPADNADLAAWVLRVLAPGGMIVLANWTGETNTPCTGDRAATLFIDACERAGMIVSLAARRDGYRLDRLSR